MVVFQKIIWVGPRNTLARFRGVDTHDSRRRNLSAPVLFARRCHRHLQHHGDPLQHDLLLLLHLGAALAADPVSESVIARAVTFQVRSYRKVALHVLAVPIWLSTFPPLLYSVKKCLTE